MSASTAGARPAAFKLSKDLPGRLAENIGENIEPAAVGHPDDDLGDTMSRRPFDCLIHERDQRLGSLERESLGARELALQEGFEDLCIGEAFEDPQLIVSTESTVVGWILEALSKPGLDGEVVDMHVLHAKPHRSRRFASDPGCPRGGDERAAPAISISTGNARSLSVRP